MTCGSISSTSSSAAASSLRTSVGLIGDCGGVIGHICLHSSVGMSTYVTVGAACGSISSINMPSILMLVMIIGFVGTL